MDRVKTQECNSGPLLKSLNIDNQESTVIGASLSEPHMNVKSGARMCNIYVCVYVCVFISYVARRVARACYACHARAMRESHVGAHVVVSARAIASTVD